MLKTLITAALLATASTVSAMHVSNFTIEGNQQIVINSPYEHVLLGAGHLNVDGTDVIGFCVDLSHNIIVGAQNYNVTYTQLTNDFNGNILTSGQISQIYKLAAYGRATNDTVVRAITQQAIWTVEYPSKSFTQAFTSAQVNAVISASSSYRALGRILTPVNGDVQSFVVSDNTIPEPATWALMVAGFGLVGLNLRNRTSYLTV